ncbi:hypothetical protein F5884DRAFT_751488 [Xylogone sp. PMI_703]|nr:hypothetical protein F5884DRAFT_751488 [Xylogone sp. PMI_703]
MRVHTLIYSLLTANIAAAVIPDQRPILDSDLGPAVPAPPSNDMPSEHNSPADGTTVILSDVLGKDRSINIFAGFTRDIEEVTRRLEDSAQNTTILAPVNSAITGLPRKPWEDPREYAALGTDAYEGGDGQDRARANIKRFVEAHLVGVSPWEEGQKVKTLVGDEVWWEMKDGVKKIQPGDTEVMSVPSKVYNGEVWILKGVRNYA